MSHPIALQLSARAELVEAALWYEEQRRGWSEELFAELRWTLAAVAERPLSFPLMRKDVRRALLRRFAYAVYFTIKEDHVLVRAIVHTSRSQRFIVRRLKNHR